MVMVIKQGAEVLKSWLLNRKHKPVASSRFAATGKSTDTRWRFALLSIFNARFRQITRNLSSTNELSPLSLSNSLIWSVKVHLLYKTQTFNSVYTTKTKREGVFWKPWSIVRICLIRPWKNKSLYLLTHSNIPRRWDSFFVKASTSIGRAFTKYPMSGRNLTGCLFPLQYKVSFRGKRWWWKWTWTVLVIAWPGSREAISSTETRFGSLFSGIVELRYPDNHNKRLALTTGKMPQGEINFLILYGWSKNKSNAV